MRLGALSFLLAAAACSGVAGTDAAPAPAAAPAPVAAAATAAPAGAAQQLWQQIEKEIGDASCDSAQQCRTLPVGNRPCGGPERYAAWSAKRSDATRLTQLGEAYAAARKTDNERAGLMSTCLMLTDPGATCSAGRCVLVKGSAAVSAQ